MFAYKFLIFSLLINISVKSEKSEKICESIVPDAITHLQNGSIVVFEKQDVWLFHKNELSLWGPCPIDKLFEGMTGPIDAAVTFDNHESVTEFVGASLYFGKGIFHTFRNLRAYQVEWGALIYLPVSGKQNKMGSKKTKKYMERVMSAAYFDPKTTRSKFVFSDETVLGFNFELGSEYDSPKVSYLKPELKKNYKIQNLPKDGLTAALTLTEKNSSKLFLFYGSQFCETNLNVNVSQKYQNCVLKPNTEFFECKNLKTIKPLCALKSKIMDTSDIPIEVQSRKKEGNYGQRIALTNEVPKPENAKVTSTPKPTPTSGTTQLFKGFLITQVISILQFLIFK